MLRAFGSPSLYIQGPSALDQLPDVVSRLGQRVFVVCDPMVATLLGARLDVLLEDAEGAHLISEFSGECTAAEIARLSNLCRNFKADVVIGVGGGKAIDTAKGVQIEIDASLIIIPTIASNDSPTSRICVVYTDDHRLDHVRTMSANPNAVVVDTGILVKAPKRFFISGIGDALSKKFESSECISAGGLNFYKHNPPFLASMLSEQCFQVVVENAESALESIDRGTPDLPFERTVEATILLSGLAFENGGLSIPHSLTRGLSSIPELSATLHGEQVAFGLIIHLLIEDADSDQLKRIYEFYEKISLPTSLSKLGYSGDVTSAARTISRVSVEKAPYIQNFSKHVTPEMIERAIIRASAMEGQG